MRAPTLLAAMARPRDPIPRRKRVPEGPSALAVRALGSVPRRAFEPPGETEWRALLGDIERARVACDRMVSAARIPGADWRSDAVAKLVLAEAAVWRSQPELAVERMREAARMLRGK